MDDDEDDILLEQEMEGLGGVIWKESSVRELLKSKGNVDVYDDFGETPLHWACNKGELAIVKELVAHGAEVNSMTYDFLRDEKSVPVLHYTVITPFCKVTEFLITSGADIHLASRKSRTAFIEACEAGYVEQVAMLIDAGVDTTKIDEDKRTGFEQALWHRKWDVVDFLISKELGNALSLEQFFRHSAYYKHFEDFKNLVERGLDPLCSFSDGKSVKQLVLSELDDWDTDGPWEDERDSILDFIKSKETQC